MLKRIIGGSERDGEEKDWALGGNQGKREGTGGDESRQNGKWEVRGEVHEGICNMSVGREGYRNIPAGTRESWGTSRSQRWRVVTTFRDHQPTAGQYLSIQEMERVPH